MIPHLLSRCVKIADSLISAHAWEKDKHRNNEKSQNVCLYFTNLPRNPTWTDCHQIWRVGCSRYLIKCTNFFDSGFHGFDSVYVIKLRPGLPIDLRCRRYTVEMCMGMGFPMGQGIPCESHGNGNKTQNWEWEWEGMGNHLSANGNYLHSYGNLFFFIYECFAQLITLNLPFAWLWCLKLNQNANVFSIVHILLNILSKNISLYWCQNPFLWPTG